MIEPTAIHHRLQVDRTLGTLHLQADLHLHAPWTLLFGPSGSGKSSLLRAACGLLGPEGVYFSRYEPSAVEVPLVTPAHLTQLHELGLAYAPQHGALFPHLSVAENVGFSLTARGEPVNPGPVVHDLLELFEIAPLHARRPHLLSGGERQRVNLARALAVPGAHLLLLDEPFSSVGRELRDRLLPRIQAWTRTHGVPVLSVSHDVDEALLLGAHVVVLEEGKVIRSGPAAQALAAERERLRKLLDLQERIR